MVEICFYKVTVEHREEHQDILVEHFIVDSKMYIRINNAVHLKM